MPKIPEELINRIRSAVNIADVIGQDVQLQKQGKNLVGHCPFHQDNTPSFSVNPEKQFFYCFSCHRSGNVFSFLQQYHHLSFPEAVEEVAKFANFQLPQEYQGHPQATPANPEQAQLLKIHAEATKLYHHVLVNTPAGKLALQYLTQRGMTVDLINQFELGYAPDLGADKQILHEYAQKAGFDYQLLRKSGLFVERHDGQLRDRFHGRVMYPIKDSHGQVIAFSGRILGKKASANTPKYLNSPETDIFNKRRTLFNLNLAREAAREVGHLTLFEGFMDVISAYGAGVKTGIASMGTSFTSEQVQIIARQVKQLNIAYDGDEAGQAAIDRALKLVEDTAPNLNLRVVQLPAGLDPDEYVQKYGAIKFQDYMEHREETPVDFRLSYLRNGLNLKKQSDLIAYLKAALQVIRVIPDPLGQSVYLKKLATEFGLDQGSLERQLAELPQPQVVTPPPIEDNGEIPRGFDPPPAPEKVIISNQPPVTQPLSKTDRAAQILLKYYCSDQDIRYQLDARLEFRFPQASYQHLYEVIKDYFSDQEKFDVAAVMDRLEPAAQTLLGQVEKQLVNEEEKQQVVKDCLFVLDQEFPLAQKIEETQAAINEASMIGDTDQLVRLTTELVQLYQRQQSMKTEEIN